MATQTAECNLCDAVRPVSELNSYGECVTACADPPES